MRASSLITSRRFCHRVFCFVLGVFVGLQMYAALWPWGSNGDRTGESRTLNTLKLLKDLTVGKLSPYTLAPVVTDIELLNVNISTNKHASLKTLLRLNSEQHIRNIEKFQLDFHDNSVVILIQVHKRLEDLQIMIESMKSVRYINQTLVVFSHDYYSPETFKLVFSIEFCPVLQLFYPYAIQFYDKQFPGDSPSDCPRDIGKEMAMARGCDNAKFPDTYGHYREGRFTQIKHHWVWKQHYVLDRVRILKDFTGVVLRLDDDYYLAEDIIHVIRLLNDEKPVACPSCLMYILGEHEELKPNSYVSETGDVVISNWFTGIGRGMAFRRDFWKVFKSCATSFCKFDDYNWDWALEYSTSNCFKGMKILKPKAGRVFHIGTCHGFHRNIKGCDRERVKRNIQNVLAMHQQNLFPHKFKVSKNRAKTRLMRQGFGGWSDPRDKELCLRFFENKTDGINMLNEVNKVITT
ncbi:alpha-1,6-mannosyl-glycoprotein 2-beta-N-acetylglucosaminyltransferase-like [Haliotis rubra]|uniref:alpha-1,6-mannosyl-glycoprotein 2-beta-N-acetylglucosaminyltransferase-like n=1 Tax=Haliotis rubra TaxID=36100 RepID=UPI001EE5C6BF|nr:alpha-1,6-mannosyl-glycoprotein 2-beta-N-acetylglucosaminyltransferase-like [Haliotis rubra]XP_046545584.1 alpha-1,6-mannosyl-glycoprotein 2-beta-N-acetylglucosaminyltransferase-like [Haliotis rubra]XP_046545585.1 alpha-1,6-mannosyl-glycoprotein 2-beta-N-acetylglucosaminyltransferase-like [Haliotis rubra]